MSFGLLLLKHITRGAVESAPCYTFLKCEFAGQFNSDDRYEL